MYRTYIREQRRPSRTSETELIEAEPKICAATQALLADRRTVRLVSSKDLGQTWAATCAPLVSLLGEIQ